MKIRSLLPAALIFTLFFNVMPGFCQHKPKALIITGSGNTIVQKDNCPPWKHAFQNRKILQILENVVELDTTTDLAMLNDQTLGAYDLLISNSLFLTPDAEQLAAMERFIAGGKPFLTLHCGLLSFLNWDKYEQLMGGIFIGGPSTEPAMFKVHTDNMEFWGYEYAFRRKSEHPVSSVVDDFMTTDELYYFQPSKSEFHVIARAENHPVMWWHPVGKGKVMSLTLGHDQHAKDNQGYQKLLVNGVRWLVGIPLIQAIDPKPISNRRSSYDNIAYVRSFTNSDHDDINFEIKNGTSPDLFTVRAGSDQSINISLTGKTGKGKAIISAKSKAGASAAELNINIVEDGKGNIASYLGNSVKVSSSENQSAMFDAGNLVDGDSTTRWSSASADSAWVTIDLLQTYAVGRVALHWEASYAAAYQVQTSQSGEKWQTVADVKQGDGKLDNLTFSPVQARYVKILAQKRAPGKWGYSLYEVEVYQR
nr:ThuA domain-containing protein [uncultured Dyadobacter sp.]